MSKYYKAEDVERLIENILNVMIGKEEPIETALCELPTIEVSEEVLKATKNFNAYTIADENAEMGMRTQIEPIIEVSEDCISRDWLEQEIEKFAMSLYKDEDYWKGWNEALEAILAQIELAPSVVPKTQIETQNLNENSKIDIVHCAECKYWNKADHICKVSKRYKPETMADHFCSYGERIDNE